jgi:hypothetical protein
MTPTLAAEGQCVTTSVPAVTIKNRCWATVGYPDHTRIRIFAREGTAITCPPSIDDWVSIPVNRDCKWPVTNNCKYSVEPHGTVRGQASFTGINDKIICEMQGLICQCRNE